MCAHTVCEDGWAGATCEVCAANHGGVNCTICAAGKASAGGSLAECSDCEAGSYSVAGGDCISCNGKAVNETNNGCVADGAYAYTHMPPPLLRDNPARHMYTWHTVCVWSSTVLPALISSCAAASPCCTVFTSCSLPCLHLVVPACVPGNGGAECAVCEPGTFSPGGDLDECTGCADGSYSAAGATNCISCDLGVASNAGKTACDTTGAYEAILLLCS